MRLYIKFIILLAVLLPTPVLAAEIFPRGIFDKDGFTLKFQDQNFNFTLDQLIQNHGDFKLPKNSNLVYKGKSLEEVSNEFLGKDDYTIRADEQSFSYNPGEIYNFVDNVSSVVAKGPTEPVLEIQSNKATKFIPPSDGIAVDKIAATLSLLKALQEGQNSIDLPYSTATPTTKLGDLNNLGINELIAKGVSNFKGSPKNRRHNIKVGVEKFKGLIIQKDEEFSFNKYLGPVEEEQGFLPELVIKKEGTIPELGGGLCQVSSTTFRAAMGAGMPILQRKNHAYAVQYYSPQGTDATIYPGVVDLKFKNDTPGAILVWPHFEEGDTLIFDFYGTKDSRVVTLEKPKQYDRKPDGSLKAEWTRIVTKDGITSTSTFKSIYQPPALFHKQEQFVGSGPTPTPSPTPTPKPTVN